MIDSNMTGGGVGVGGGGGQDNWKKHLSVIHNRRTPVRNNIR